MSYSYFRAIKSGICYGFVSEPSYQSSEAANTQRQVDIHGHPKAWLAHFFLAWVDVVPFAIYLPLNRRGALEHENDVEKV